MTGTNDDQSRSRTSLSSPSSSSLSTLPTESLRLASIVHDEASRGPAVLYNVAINANAMSITREQYWINHYNSINEGLNSDGKNRGKTGRTLPQSAKDEKSRKMKKNWLNGSFKRNYGKSIKDNNTGKIYNSRKECVEDLKINQNKFYKILGEHKQLSYINT